MSVRDIRAESEKSQQFDRESMYIVHGSLVARLGSSGRYYVVRGVVRQKEADTRHTGKADRNRTEKLHWNVPRIAKGYNLAGAAAAAAQLNSKAIGAKVGYAWHSYKYTCI